MWYVYILECENKTLYTGITKDLDRRFKAHRAGTGAKFTRSFKAAKIVYAERKRTRGTAARRECEIKSWSRDRKLALIRSVRAQKR